MNTAQNNQGSHNVVNSFIGETPFSTCLNYSNSNSGISSSLPHWVLDSGAIDHVSNYLSYFTEYDPIYPCKIKLPSGSITHTFHICTIKLSPELILYDVFFFPDFQFNIIFVHILIVSLNCNLNFTKYSCSIKDPHHSKMIEYAHRRLYILGNYAFSI